MATGSLKRVDGSIRLRRTQREPVGLWVIPETHRETHVDMLNQRETRSLEREAGCLMCAGQRLPLLWGKQPTDRPDQQLR